MSSTGIDGDLIVAVVGVILTGVCGIFLYLIQRNITNKDTAAHDRKVNDDLAFDKWKGDMERRMSDAERDTQKLEVQLQNKPSRDEVKADTTNVFAEIKDLRTEMNSKMDGLQGLLIRALGNKP